MRYVSTLGKNWRNRMTARVGAILDLDISQAQRNIRSIEKEINSVGKQKVKVEADLTKIKQAESELKKVTQEIENLTKKKNSIQVDFDKATNLKNQIHEITNSIKLLNAEIKETKNNSDLKLDVKNNLLSDLNKQKDLLTAKKQRLEVQLDGYSDVVSKYNDLEKRIAKLQAQKAKIEVQAQGSEQAQNELDKIDYQIDQLNTEKASIQTQVENYNATMQELDNIANKVEKLKSVGSTMYNIGSKMTNLPSLFNNTAIGSAMNFLVQGVGYSTMYRLTSEAMNTLSESVSNAIDRYDQLNVSARTLQTLGYETEEVAKAQQKLSDSIEGLPTVLNDALSQVSTFTSINGDLTRSTKLFTAFNDAILAFGGSSENVQNAITQYSQIMGSKMDARTLLSLQDANMMPVLTAIAEEFGMTYAEFREAFTGTSPTISLEEFEDALISLDENGGGSLKALSQMAQESVETIGNAFELIGVRASKGMAQIVEAFDDVIKEQTGKSIYENVYDFTEKMEKEIGNFANTIVSHSDEIGGFLETMTSGLSGLWNVIKQFDLGSFIDGLSSFKWVIDGLAGIAKGFASVIGGIANVVGGGDTSKGLGRMIAAWFTAGYGLKFSGKFLETFADPLVKFFSGKKLTTISDGISKLKGLLVKGNTKGTTDLSSLGGGTDIKTTGTSFLGSMSNIAKLTALAGSLIVWAKAIKQLDDALPDDIGAAATKLGELVVMIGVMTGITAGLGKISESASGMMTTGLLTLIGEGGAMIVVAKGISELSDALPDDITSTVEKMGSFLTIITAFTAVVAALGGLVVGSEGLGAIILALGAVFTIGLAETMKIVAESISTMAEAIGDIGTAVKKFGNLEIDADGVQENMGIVLEAMESISGMSDGFMDALGKLARQKIDEGNISQASSNINKLVDVAKGLKKLSKYSTQSGNFESGMGTLKNSLLALQTYFPLPHVNIGENTSDNLTEIADALKGLKTIANAINKLIEVDISNIDTEILTTTISKINEVVTSMKEVRLPDVESGATLNQENAQNLADVLDTFIEIIPKFSEFTAAVQANPISVEELQTAFQSMANLLGSINEEMPNGQNRLGYNLENFIDADDVQNVLDAFTNLSSLVETIKAFTDTWAQNSIDFETLKANFEQLGGALQSIVETWTGQGLELDSFKDINKVIKKMNDIATNLNTLGSTQINFEAIQSMITQIQGVLTSLSGITGTDEANSIATSIQSVVDTFNQLVTTLKGMEESFQEVGMEWGNAIYTGFENSDVSGQMSAYIDEAMATLKEKNFTSIGLNYGKQLVNGFRSGLTGMSNALSSQISGLNGYASTFASLGATLGNALVTGFTGASAGIANSISNVASTVSTVKSTISALKFANGGIVPQYLASGGVSFRPRGTDTVPAMLTPGEFVIRKKAVDNVGLSFLRKVNNMDLKGAFSSLVSAHGSNSMQTSYSRTIVKNTTNNADNRSVVIYGKNERQEELKARRFMKCLA